MRKKLQSNRTGRGGDRLCGAELIEYAGIAPIGVILGDRVTVYDFGDHAAIPLVCQARPTDGANMAKDKRNTGDMLITIGLWRRWHIRFLYEQCAKTRTCGSTGTCYR